MNPNLKESQSWRQLMWVLILICFVQISIISLETLNIENILEKCHFLVVIVATGGQKCNKNQNQNSHQLTVGLRLLQIETVILRLLEIKIDRFLGTDQKEGKFCEAKFP